MIEETRRFPFLCRILNLSRLMIGIRKFIGEDGCMRRLFVSSMVFCMALGWCILPVKASMIDYTIDTPEELMSISDQYGSYILASDIDLSGITTFTPLFPDGFTGSFDGQGHTIKNLAFAKTYDSTFTEDKEPKVGLFASVSGTIENLNLENISFDITAQAPLQGFVGILAGVSMDADFSNIQVSNGSILYRQTMTDPANSFFIGGLVGMMVTNDDYLTDIQLDFDFSGSAQYVGGMAGSLANNGVAFRNIDIHANLQNALIQGGLIGAVGNLSNTADLLFSNVGVRGNIQSISNVGALFGELDGVDQLMLEDVTTALVMKTTDYVNTDHAFSDLMIQDFNTNGSGNNQVNIQRMLAQNRFVDPLESWANTIAIDDSFTTISINDAYALSSQGFLSSTPATVLSSSDAKQAENYYNFDFTGTWVIHPLFNNGYPYLRYNLGYLTYNSNGGSALSTQPFFKREAIPQPTNPIRDGYVFAGWYVDESLSQSFDFTASNHSVNQTLYAKWTPIQSESSSVSSPTESVLLLNEKLPNTGIVSVDGMWLLVLGVLLIKMKDKN